MGMQYVCFATGSHDNVAPLREGDFVVDDRREKRKNLSDGALTASRKVLG
jgi:hypothetical protein